MSTSMRVVIKCVAAVIIKLVDETNGKRSDNFHGKRRNEVNTIYRIRNKWANQICDPKRKYNYQRCYNDVSEFQDSFSLRLPNSIPLLHLPQSPLSIFKCFILAASFLFDFFKALSGFIFVALLFGNFA